MGEQDGLICAYLLDGRGGGRQLDWPAIESWTPEDGPLWVHVHRHGPEGRRWLHERSGLNRLVCDALLAEDTRPRSTAIDEGLLVILRGVNLNPGADPEDMVSVRLWIDAHRAISVRVRHLMAVEDVRKSLVTGAGPRTSADLVAELAERLVERMGPTIADLDDAVDELEDKVLTAHSAELRAELGALRRQAITLRRYIAPQRDVLTRLQTERVAFIGEGHRLRLRENVDRVTRYVEDLDAARERAAVMQEELSHRLSEQMNRTMYVLSVVAAIFLPLGLLTGLLGINVGGIPGTDNPRAFAYVALFLAVLAGGQAWVLRRLRLF